MTQTGLGEQACQQALAELDSFIDNELMNGRNPALLEHFERCTACTREAQERRQTRARLRTAVRQAQAPPGLEGRVRDRLREAQRPPSKRFHLMAIAAAVAVCFGSWAAYYRGKVHPTTASQEQYIAAISGQVAAIMRVGLGDHLHCAVIRQRSDPSKTAADNLPAQFKELLPIIHQQPPAGLPLLTAHECRYHGRTFVHLVFRNDRNLLSLVIARKQDGELLATGIHTAGARQFQIAALESSGYLIYTVSDLPQQRNLDVLMALAPALQKFLNQMGA